MENVLKISFLGDITCDRPMLRAAACKDGSFNFNDSFAKVKPLFQEADYVIGNLETVCAGADLGYNPGAVTYNSPDGLIAALKEAGITMLTTANNHTLDCGIDGLYRTLDILDKNGILHTGAVRNPDAPACERFRIIEKNGIRVAIVALTATMNSKSNGNLFTKAEWNSVNEIWATENSIRAKSLKQKIKRFLPTKLIQSVRVAIKRHKRIPLIPEYADNRVLNQDDIQQFEVAKEILKCARNSADFVVACIHSGGQFNAEPGSFSKMLYAELEPFADAIIGNHPHVVQKMIRGKNNRLIAFSLGSLNMSQSSDYINKKNAPEFSIMLNLHLKKDADGNVEVYKESFSLLHAQENEQGYLFVSPWTEDEATSEQKDRATMVLERFCGTGANY